VRRRARPNFSPASFFFFFFNRLGALNLSDNRTAAIWYAREER